MVLERLDLARPAADRELGRGLADHGDRPDRRRDRQDVALVAQQRRRLLRDPLGGLAVGHLVDLRVVVAVGRAVEDTEPEPRLEHHADVLVDRGLLDLPERDRRRDQQRLIADRWPRLEVEPVVEAAVGRVDRQVVGDRVALEAPLVAQDLLEQRGVLAGVLTVDPVVCAHDRADLGLLDGGLELRQVDLAHRAVVDDRVLRIAGPDDAEPGGQVLVEEPTREVDALLVVGREVLDVADHTGRLRTLDPRHAQTAGQQRVLAIALERTAGQRGTRDVDRRGVDDVVALGLGLRRGDRAVRPSQLGVERRGKRQRCRQPDRLALTRADRSVAVVDRRHVQAGYALLDAGVGVRAAERAAHQVVAAEQTDLLVERELGEEQVGPLAGAQRGVAPRVVAAPARGDGRRGRCEGKGRTDRHGSEDQAEEASRCHGAPHVGRAGAQSAVNVQAFCAKWNRFQVCRIERVFSTS